MLAGNSFIVENTFKGILPTVPYLANYSEGFSPSALDAKISQIENDGLATWTDSYNEGQVMNRLIQTARIADQTGNIIARDKMIATVKERLEDWLTFESGEKAFLFYYNQTWSAMLGYPSGHGQDTNINDHHFHWGYFIHAASFMEQFQPGWAAQWGAMINTLIKDAASYDRTDALFPFLRNFSPYAGHSWANGFASFPQGNDQESTSESMQFASSLIHWGTITENEQIRDLGIYIYTTEQTAVEEYWFDVHNRNFASNQQYSLVSRVWGNSYDNGTFWTSDIAASYGIEMYPIHGGSFYLGHHQDYAKNLWSEISQNTGVLNQEDNDNLWHDTYWKFLSMTNPQEAVNLYDAYPDRNLKFGISDAQTYHWLHSVNALGVIDATITADYPIAAAFSKDGDITYVAHNYANTLTVVTFSDGYQLTVPANEMKTSKDVNVSGVLTSNFSQAFPNGSVDLSVNTTGSNVTKVEFFDGSTKIGEVSTAPYELKAEGLTLGIHGFYAKVYENTAFNVTNIVEVQVGEQVSYLGNPHIIPGEIEVGHYDIFEGGIGQSISYVDTSVGNNGTFRPDENIDAVIVNGEGATVGWNAAGEWLEFTVDVQNSGNYNLDFRYASGNESGGGPFYFEVEGKKVSSDITVNYTSDWDNWQTASVSNIELTSGVQVLRLYIVSGEFNIGKLTFSYDSALSFVPPIADAGETISIIAPTSTANLDGSASNDPEGEAITYSWQQIYGPTTAVISDNTIVNPSISNLENGVYKFKLTVSDGSYEDTDEVLVVVTSNGNVNPTISINSPTNNATFKEGEEINITTTTNDLDGTIELVEFFNGTTKLGETVSTPFSYNWTDAAIGSHQITAVATDDFGGKTTSQAISISVTEEQKCEEVSAEASQGSFSQGYKVSFETIGNAVTIQFELLDTDKAGVIAYLWKKSPFGETQMSQESGLLFTSIVGGVTTGETISYACKFAYAGGLSATKYFDYVVGTNCSADSSDTTIPENFTASIGEITASSVELLLNATDNSGRVVYDVSYNNTTQSVSEDSGVEKSIIINGLSAETSYSFSIDAKDLSGNEAANNSIVLEATTSENTNSDCSGTSSSAAQGSFSIGYSYEFITNGTDVTINFELLDTDKSGVVAYLWKQTPFSEVQMNSTGHQRFSKTLSGLSAGETISYACKFAFAGGLAVTEYLSYTVGDNCTLNTDDFYFSQGLRIFPNPVKNTVSVTSEKYPISKIEIYSLIGKKIKVFTSDFNLLQVDELTSGLYLIKVYNENRSHTTKFIKK